MHPVVIFLYATTIELYFLLFFYIFFFCWLMFVTIFPLWNVCYFYSLVLPTCVTEQNNQHISFPESLLFRYWFVAPTVLSGESVLWEDLFEMRKSATESSDDYCKACGFRRAKQPTLSCSWESHLLMVDNSHGGLDPLMCRKSLLSQAPCYGIGINFIMTERGEQMGRYWLLNITSPCDALVHHL